VHRRDRFRQEVLGPILAAAHATAAARGEGRGATPPPAVPRTIAWGAR
jgi:hypothetical protein